MEATERWGVIDEQSIADARELIGVPLRRDRMQWNKVATSDAIRQFAEGVGDDNPLWTQGFAPPSFLYAVDATIVAPKLPGVQWIYAGTRWRWWDRIRENDVFDVSAQFVEMEEKTGRRFGLWVLQKGEIEYRRDDGGLISVAEGRVARTPRRSRSKSKAKTESAALPREAESYGPQLSGEPRRGSDPRMWESVSVGDAVGPVARPLSLDRIFAWYTGAQGALHYGGAHGDAVRYRRRHADYEINRVTGAKDSAARGHFSSREGKDVGMGGAYDVGLHRIAWAIAFVTDWMGDDAHLAEADIDVLRPNLVGDTTFFSGVVTAKWRNGQPDQILALVRLDIEGRNQSNVVTTRGSAVVTLPSSTHGPVLLPLLDGDRERWVQQEDS